MNKKPRYLFVINPVAGKGKALEIRDTIKKFDKIFEYKVLFTEKELKIKSLVKPLLDEIWEGVIVAGGDGTINETASLLAGKNIPMGIIPMGSGNGLGRHFKIPLNPEKALKTILNGKIIDMDVCCAGEFMFFNTAGIGFDAYVAKLFDENKTGRGLLNYVKCSIKAWYNYKAKNYTLHIDDKKITTPAFLIEIANSSQFGNNAVIAPEASVTDGLMDVTIIRKVSFISALPLLAALFKGKIHTKKDVLIFKCTKLTINNITDDIMHVDGEVRKIKKETCFQIFSKKIKVLVPENFEE